MKAFAKQRSGAITLTDLPKPQADSTEILVKLAAIGVGIHDEYFHAPDIAYPYVIGIEGAGTVVATGSDVSNYSAGDRLAFVSMIQPKGGTWAEYAVVAQNSLIVRVPDGMSFKQAATFPVAGNTALKALQAANLQPGQSVFIAGGAGALGTLLIQLATQRGYTVIASASKKNHAYMKSLGASGVVDYHDSDWQQRVRALLTGGASAAIAIHPGTPLESQSVVADGGVLVAVSGDNFVAERGITLKTTLHTIDVTHELGLLIDQIARGIVIQTIDKVYPFNEALDALAQVKTRHTRGKLVLSCDPTLFTNVHLAVIATHLV